MATTDLKMIMKRTVSVDEYINKLAQPLKARFLKRKLSYQLNQEAVHRLRSFAEDVVIVVFSADWCKDCAANVPVLNLLVEKRRTAWNHN